MREATKIQYWEKVRRCLIHSEIGGLAPAEAEARINELREGFSKRQEELIYDNSAFRVALDLAGLELRSRQKYMGAYSEILKEFPTDETPNHAPSSNVSDEELEPHGRSDATERTTGSLGAIKSITAHHVMIVLSKCARRTALLESLEQESDIAPIVASNSSEALRKLGKQKIDLVVLFSAQLHQSTSSALFAAIRKSWDMPIVVVGFELPGVEAAEHITDQEDPEGLILSIRKHLPAR